MKNEKLIKLNDKFKSLAGRGFKHVKRVGRISLAEDRKILRVVSFWVLTAAMCLIALGSVVYENVILLARVNYDGYDDETFYVQQEWIDAVTASKQASEKAIEDSNLKYPTRESMKAAVKDKERQIEFLQYLKDNNIPLRLKEVVNDDADYVYYVDGYAYRFDDISFSITEGDTPPISLGGGGGDTYLILSDERSGDSVFEANLIFYFVAVLLVVLCFSDEFSTGTIKLVVSKPVTRRDIGVSKLLSITSLLTLSWAISAVLYLLFSLCFKNPVKYVLFAGGLTAAPVWAFNMLTFIDIWLVSLGFIAVSVLFAVRFKNNIVAVILPFIVYFFKSILVRVVPNLAVIDVFENLKLMQHFVLGDSVYGATRVWQALLTSCGIMLLLMVLAIRRFRRYDMDKLK